MPQTEAVCGKEFVERRLYLLFKFIIIYLYNIFNSFVRKDFGKKNWKLCACRGCAGAAQGLRPGCNPCTAPKRTPGQAGEKRNYASSVLHIGMQGEPI